MVENKLSENRSLQAELSDANPAARENGPSVEREIRYHALFESTGDAIMLLDQQGFIECNEATLKLFGCRTREEFISKHPSELSPLVQPDGVDSREAANRRIAEAYQNGIARFEWLHRRIDGTDVMADVLLARVDLTGRRILQAVVRDITERKRIEQELREAHEELEMRVKERTVELATTNEELKREIAERKKAEEDLAFERFLLTTLMGRAPDFIFFKDRESRFIRISKGLADYYGLTDPEDAIGRSDLDFYDTDRARFYMKDEKRIMETGQAVVDKEEEQIWPDGRVTWLLTSKVPLYSSEGEIIGTFGISRDITYRKRAEAAMREAKEIAEAANRAKSDFLANMSHEIRTPMNAILGMTELLLDTPMTDSQREYLKMVGDSGESLLSLINDILDFSKIEAGKLDLEHEAFDLRETVGDTLKSLALRAHAKGLELACDVESKVPEWLIGDAGRLRQIVVNLVGNAIKFTQQGEVVLCVKCLQHEHDRALLRFSVSDTGIGIPKSKLKTIFGAFEQADNSTTRRYGGTGLGLAICERLVKAMEGNVEVESQPGQGSVFSFTIRYDVATSPPKRTTIAEPIVVANTPVLIVDDNATNRRILEKIVRNWRMVPTAVASAREALARLAEAHHGGHPYTLVLTDGNMPDQDGFSLAEQIKQSDKLGGTIIMMLTSGGRPGDIARCEQLGITSYLLKPVKQSELFDAIALALGITVAEDEHQLADDHEQLKRLGTLRILLVEDSLVNQKLAVGLLEKYGHHVTVANHGREAIVKLRSHRFDLILMDVQMPEMDGLEATTAIRVDEIRTGTHIPIVAMTAHAMKGDRERCLDAGMDGYVAKPIRARELFETIERVLSTVQQSSSEAESAAVSPSREIDWQQAAEAAGGDRELMKDVADAFLEEGPRLLRQMRQATDQQDSGSLHIAAHTLKSALRNVGAQRASETAFELEQLARDGKVDQADKLLASLETNFQRVTDELHRYWPALRAQS